MPSKDQWAQIAYLAVSESAANTLTFNGLSVFSNVLSQRAMIIHRAEYSFAVGAFADIDADQDGIKYGLAGDDGIATISLDDPTVYDYNFLIRLDAGTAASANILQAVIPKDFTALPGGGLLVPADRLYLFVQGNTLTAAVAAFVRVWFTLVDLSAQEYLELAQAMRVLK